MRPPQTRRAAVVISFVESNARSFSEKKNLQKPDFIIRFSHVTLIVIVLRGIMEKRNLTGTSQSRSSTTRRSFCLMLVCDRSTMPVQYHECHLNSKLFLLLVSNTVQCKLLSCGKFRLTDKCCPLVLNDTGNTFALDILEDKKTSAWRCWTSY